MIDPLDASIKIAGSGLEAQSARLRVVSENMANVQSTGKTAGANPYRRKTITFENELDRTTGVNLVKVGDVGTDRAAFRTEYDPGNPAADEKGMVKMPNVNMLLEMSDLREANRSYEANLQVVKETRDLFSMTIDLLKSSS
jgi:flagellar basal-body rod protein FlgC